ncbi:sphinganine-1-phosphate aldolase [Puccinia sorghi]|uniref:Sphinganine-1-phosphate aldolase n=1 Tax=Puccinia sorghi TaxID=27349 RepID=A0A0L6U6E3_9BASI|nr:sphinganine-1-phosphate aldolase [Puccinia sorghi]
MIVQPKLCVCFNHLILLCSLALNYPDGEIHDITAVGKLKKKYNLHLGELVR